MSPPGARAQVLYGALFVVALPALLVTWARSTRGIVRLPVPFAPALGLSLSVAGLALLALGMLALRLHGQGWPLNIAPPRRHVSRGVYALTPHPIYTGACLLSVGVSAVAGSSSGTWLVSPALALCCAALVLGFERHDLQARFGDEAARIAILPADDPAPRQLREIVSVYLHVLVPWFLLYEAVIGIGVPPDAVSAFLPLEHRWPVWEWTEALYGSCYVVAGLAPLVAGSSKSLRRFAVRGLLAMAVAFPLFLLLPLVAEPRAFVPEGPLGRLLAFERAHDAPVAAFPSFHVIWAWLAADVFAERWPRLRAVSRAWALLVAASCVTTGMHALIDVVGGLLVIALVDRRRAVWSVVRRGAERVANSWREWRAGRVRVISHGLYAGAAGFVGAAVGLIFAGAENAAALMLAGVGGLAAAGLWAQLVEGSSALLRPFGYYGGLIGVALGALLAPRVGGDGWAVLAALSLGAPWVQAVGRLRCLVQGCCHGRPGADVVGIRYLHPRSRVTRLTGWAGIPLHPTPVYSILWNLMTGLALARLWTLGAPPPLVTGSYLILNGAGRFVEEAYRGEPQTPIIGGLRLYQWMATAGVVLGALVTTLPSGALPPHATVHWWYAGLAGAFGVANFLAMGVDVPDSSRRFSRLA